MKKYSEKNIIVACLIVVSCLALAVLAGCGGIMQQTPPPASAQPTQAATLPPTQEPAPTDTPALTTEPAATETAAASQSPEATETPADTSTADATATPGDSTEPADSATPGASASAGATATPDAAPTPAAKPEPTVNHAGDRSDVKVTKYYGRTSPDWLPAGLGVKLKYDKYWNNKAPNNFLDYFVFSRSGTVRSLPQASGKSLQALRSTGRLALLAQVKGLDGKVWYRVLTSKGAVGYAPATSGFPVSFKVDEAFREIKKLKAVVDKKDTLRISNYNNRAGLPPKLPGGKSEDPYGNLRDQSAPAYLMPDATSSFRYAPDGLLCQKLGEKNGFVEVYIPAWDEVRYVPAKNSRKTSYFASGDPVKTLTQAVVVNRNPKGQNIMVFELIGSKWNIISMCYVSTGANHGAHDPTPLGDFFTEKHKGHLGLGEFFYFPDGTPGTDANGKPKFDGYAPWAIRFTAGAYLHGMPISVHYDATTNLMTGGRGTSEIYGDFIGVYPASHMCVRNYTSHAKFMWDWVKDGQASVIVIE